MVVLPSPLNHSSFAVAGYCYGEWKFRVASRFEPAIRRGRPTPNVGAEERDRTSNLWFTKPLLYH